MSQQEPQSTQPTVRHIPIFVEGRSEPLLNKLPDPPASEKPSNNPQHSASFERNTHTMPEAPRMEMPSHNSDFFKQHGSIFDRARDFPVRSFPNSSSFFKQANSSPARESSPARQVPIFATESSVPPSHQQASAHPQSAPRGSSMPRQTPSPPTAAQQQQQYQQQQAARYQQYQQDQAAKQAAPTAQDQPDSKPKQPPPPVANDPISKIQRIQRDVLDIFDQVERFQGGKDGKRDKTYIYLDEMLTQNLLKLDSIDAEDQPQIKSARREAIKSINHCIAVLEAKAEAAGTPESSMPTSGSSDKLPNGTAANRTGSGGSLSQSSSISNNNSSSQQQSGEQQ
ncbi:BAG domain-containing protein Samui [Uranotaenia lowii]|uniref:BAG domain-containing protein Samui n=1 Tax=Uranotaenia lowii TaxID=190385 RepID=UPI002479DE19|nr:BAG domain-containing protein Samui [Uranotaenia lowii]